MHVSLCRLGGSAIGLSATSASGRAVPVMEQRAPWRGGSRVNFRPCETRPLPISNQAVGVKTGQVPGVWVLAPLKRQKKRLGITDPRRADTKAALARGMGGGRKDEAANQGGPVTIAACLRSAFRH